MYSFKKIFLEATTIEQKSVSGIDAAHMILLKGLILPDHKLETIQQNMPDIVKAENKEQPYKDPSQTQQSQNDLNGNQRIDQPSHEVSPQIQQHQQPSQQPHEQQTTEMSKQVTPKGPLYNI